MNKLWEYRDYVDHLSHQNKLVRQWAYKALEQRHRNRYADEVRVLLDDEDAHMVSNALRYLTYHKAIQHAPAILEKFISSSGLVASNAAIALSRMEYEPAIDTILEHFHNPDSQDRFAGMLDYLGHIENEKCRDALRAFIDHLRDDFLVKSTISSLLLHRNTEDINFALNKIFDSTQNTSPHKIVLKDIANALDGGQYFDGLAYGGDSNIWLEPEDALDDFFYFNVNIELDTDKFDEIVAHLEQSQYENLVKMLAFDARSIIQNRYPDKPIPEQLKKLSEKDSMCLAMLENLSKRSSVWKTLKKVDSPPLIPFVMAIYFAIKERDVYAQVLGAENVSVDALIRTLEKAGPSLPIEIQRMIQDVVPTNDLKEFLTEDLDNWCDIWTVRIMGEKRNIEFIPDLLRVFREADSLDFIYSDAEYALKSMDESADEILLSAAQSGELGAWESFSLLERLPYSEAYDAAVRIWESDDSEMDSWEVFAMCLESIGDIRGIEKLQEIYHGENDADYIGDAMECLGSLHGVDIPELPDIMEKRRQRRELRQARRKELNDLARQYNARVEKGESVENVVPFKRNEPKVGRNEPCPCGSGKKYKKCCLDKD